MPPLASRLCNSPKCTQAIQTVLLTLVTLGGSAKYDCSLLIPTLRLDEQLVSKLMEACSSWVFNDHEPLTALTIVGSFTSPCNSADLPAARAACTALRAQPYFASLLEHSLLQAALTRTTSPPRQC